MRYGLPQLPTVAGLAVLLGGVLITSVGAWRLTHSNSASANRRLYSIATRASDEVRARLGNYAMAVRGARGMVAAIGADKITIEQLRTYWQTEGFSFELQGADAIGLLRLRPGPPGQPKYRVLREPAQFDPGSSASDQQLDSALLAAVQQSSLVGDMVLSGPATPADPRAAHHLMYLTLPIDPIAMQVNGAPAGAPASGSIWIYSPLVMENVLKGLAFDAEEVSMDLRDLSSPGEPVLFTSPGATADAIDGFEVHLPMRLYGRNWEAVVRAKPALFSATGQRQPLKEMTGGLVLTSLLAALMFFGTRRKIRLHASTARRSSIAFACNDAVIEEALDGSVVSWSRTCEAVFGYAPGAAIGRSLSRLILSKGQEAEDGEARARVMRGESLAPIDTFRQHRDGTLIHVSMIMSAIVAEGGEIQGVARTFRDASQTIHEERRLLEINAKLERQVAERTASLEATRNDLRMILDAMPAMIAYFDNDLINRFANRASEKWFGTPRGSLPGKHARELLGSHQYERDFGHIEGALAGNPQTFEQSRAKLDGDGYQHVLTHYIPDIKDGRVQGVYVLIHDVSEVTENRLRLAAALRDNEALLGTLNLHSKVSVTDERGIIIEVNDNFCRFLGYERDELLGYPHSLVNSGTHERGFWTDMWGQLTSGRPWRGEICNRAKDGSLHWVDSIIAPFLGNNGRVQKYVQIGTDITISKAVESRLRYNEAFLERIGSIAGVGGWDFDLKSRKVSWSPQTYRLLEVDSHFEPNVDAELSFYSAEARPILDEAMRECEESGTPWDLELRAETAKGRAIWVRSVGAPEMQDGHIVRLIGALQDVTARKNAEIELKNSIERFAIATDSAGIGVWEWDAEKDRILWNDWMYRIYGIEKTRDAETYDTWKEALHPEDRKRCQAELDAASRGHYGFNSEFRIVRDGGEVRYIKAASRAIRAADGTTLRMTGVNFDVTDARRLEMMARRATDSLLQTVLDSASEISIVATDENLLIKVFNAGAERMLGYSQSEMVGVASLAQIHDAAEMATYEGLRDTQAGLDPRAGSDGGIHEGLIAPSMMRRSRERIYVRKDGSRITVSLFMKPMLSEEGRTIGYVCVAHDITQQIEDQRILLEAIDKAEKANNAKSLFLANMSHEIRTPMNAVIGLSYLMSRTSLSEEQAKFLGNIQTASGSLLSIINNILDLSKIEAGELLVESVIFSLSDLVRDVAAIVAVQAEAKQLNFAMEAQENLPAALTGDPTRLKQILINLLSNAIRFTDRGSVRLKIVQLPASGDAITLSFAIADTGIGIAPADQSRLFAPFVQADASVTRRYGGTGLGLSIVKQLTKLLGGTVGFESTVGIGSTFSVILSFQPVGLRGLEAVREISNSYSRVTLRGVRALVVDDSDINLEVARRILEVDGVEVSLAIDGQEAVDLLAKTPGSFDVVLMDIQMPILDGYEATRRIRRELGLVELPIVAVTAGALSSERQKALDAGMDDFICKPFDAQSLASCILRNVRPSDMRAAVRKPAGREAPPIAWPEIEGIDTQDARTRWCGDAALFTQMLGRLFEDFPEVGLPSAPQDGQAFALHARRMHKLRGGACMLGAKSVYVLAGEVESACIARDIDRATEATERLVAELGRLHGNARALLQAPRPRLEERSAPIDPKISARHIGELDLLLKQQNLAAVEYFRVLSPHLRRLMGRTAFERMRKDIDDLQFERASNHLLERSH